MTDAHSFNAIIQSCTRPLPNNMMNPLRNGKATKETGGILDTRDLNWRRQEALKKGLPKLPTRWPTDKSMQKSFQDTGMGGLPRDEIQWGNRKYGAIKNACGDHIPGIFTPHRKSDWWEKQKRPLTRYHILYPRRGCVLPLVYG